MRLCYSVDPVDRGGGSIRSYWSKHCQWPWSNRTCVWSLSLTASLQILYGSCFSPGSAAVLFGESSFRYSEIQVQPLLKPPPPHSPPQHHLTADRAAQRPRTSKSVVGRGLTQRVWQGAETREDLAAQTRIQSRVLEDGCGQASVPKVEPNPALISV